MNGLNWIENTTTKDLAAVLRISVKEAEKIKTMTLPELEQCEHICLEVMNLPDMRGKCRNKLYHCNDCRKEFLCDEGIQSWR